MIEFLSELSLYIGHVWHDIVQFVIYILAIFGLYHIFFNIKSSCTHDCNQGRNCTCKEKSNGIHEKDVGGNVNRTATYSR